MLVKTSGDSSCSRRLVIAYTGFDPPSVSEIAPPSVAMFGGATDEDSDTLP